MIDERNGVRIAAQNPKSNVLRDVQNNASYGVMSSYFVDFVKHFLTFSALSADNFLTSAKSEVRICTLLELRKRGNAVGRFFYAQNLSIYDRVFRRPFGVAVCFRSGSANPLNSVALLICTNGDSLDLITKGDCNV